MGRLWPNFLLAAVAALALPWTEAFATPPAKPSTASTPAVAPVASVTPPIDRSSSYQVGAGDVLRIDVFDDPKLSGDFAVGAEGQIVFPLLGPVAVRGETVGAIKALLTRLLEKDYLYNPNVGVSVKEFKSQKVKLLGSVTKPGIYYLDGPTRLFDLLSKAEGTSRELGEIRRGQTARLVRDPPREGDSSAANDGITRVIDLYDLLVAGKEEANIPLRNGDVIYVGKSESVHVVGEVKKPGSYPHEAGMTVLKAVSLAGGATKKGTIRGAVIKRIRGGKEQKIDARPEDQLEPDDVVEVPLSFW